MKVHHIVSARIIIVIMLLGITISNVHPAVSAGLQQEIEAKQAQLKDLIRLIRSRSIREKSKLQEIQEQMAGLQSEIELLQGQLKEEKARAKAVASEEVQRKIEEEKKRAEDAEAARALAEMERQRAEEEKRQAAERLEQERRDNAQKLEELRKKADAAQAAGGTVPDEVLREMARQELGLPEGSTDASIEQRVQKIRASMVASQQSVAATIQRAEDLRLQAQKAVDDKVASLAGVIAAAAADELKALWPEKFDTPEYRQQLGEQVIPKVKADVMAADIDGKTVAVRLSELTQDLSASELEQQVDVLTRGLESIALSGEAAIQQELVNEAKSKELLVVPAHEKIPFSVFIKAINSVVMSMVTKSSSIARIGDLPFDQEIVVRDKTTRGGQGTFNVEGLYKAINQAINQAIGAIKNIKNYENSRIKDFITLLINFLNEKYPFTFKKGGDRSSFESLLVSYESFFTNHLKAPLPQLLVENANYYKLANPEQPHADNFKRYAFARLNQLCSDIPSEGWRLEEIEALERFLAHIVVIRKPVYDDAFLTLDSRRNANTFIFNGLNEIIKISSLQHLYNLMLDPKCINHTAFWKPISPPGILFFVMAISGVNERSLDNSLKELFLTESSKPGVGVIGEVALRSVTFYVPFADGVVFVGGSLEEQFANWRKALFDIVKIKFPMFEVKEHTADFVAEGSANGLKGLQQHIAKLKGRNWQNSEEVDRLVEDVGKALSSDDYAEIGRMLSLTDNNISDIKKKEEELIRAAEAVQIYIDVINNFAGDNGRDLFVACAETAEASHFMASSVQNLFARFRPLTLGTSDGFINHYALLVTERYQNVEAPLKQAPVLTKKRLRKALDEELAIYNGFVVGWEVSSGGELVYRESEAAKKLGIKKFDSVLDAGVISKRRPKLIEAAQNAWLDGKIIETFEYILFDFRDVFPEFFLSKQDLDFIWKWTGKESCVDKLLSGRPAAPSVQAGRGVPPPPPVPINMSGGVAKKAPPPPPPLMSGVVPPPPPGMGMEGFVSVPRKSDSSHADYDDFIKSNRQYFEALNKLAGMKNALASYQVVLPKIERGIRYLFYRLAREWILQVSALQKALASVTDIDQLEEKNIPVIFRGRLTPFKGQNFQDLKEIIGTLLQTYSAGYDQIFPSENIKVMAKDELQRWKDDIAQKTEQDLLTNLLVNPYEEIMRYSSASQFKLEAFTRKLPDEVVALDLTRYDAEIAAAQAAKPGVSRAVSLPVSKMAKDASASVEAAKLHSTKSVASTSLPSGAVAPTSGLPDVQIAAIQEASEGLLQLFTNTFTSKTQDAMVRLLQAGARADVVDSHGNGILHLAAKTGLVEQVLIALRLYKKFGVDVNRQNNLGHTAFHAYIDVLKELDASSQMFVHFSKLVRLLLEGRITDNANREAVDVIDPNIQDRDGNTALHLLTQTAVFLDRGKIFRRFKEEFPYIASCMENPFIPNAEGKTVFELIEEHPSFSGDQAELRMIKYEALRKRLTISLKRYREDGGLNDFEAFTEPIIAKNEKFGEFGENLLQVVVQWEEATPEMVEFLMDKGLSAVETSYAGGLTALHLAAQTSSKTNNFEVFEKMLEKGGDEYTRAIFELEDPTKATPADYLPIYYFRIRYPDMWKRIVVMPAVTGDGA